MQAPEELSPWWGRLVAVTFFFGFAVLILLTVKAYQNAPPIAARVVEPGGALVYSGDDVRNGQAVFLKRGLMDNGTIWGHGAYLGPDFGAAVLHHWAQDLAERTAQANYAKPYGDLSDVQKAAIDGEVASLLKVNRYDAGSDTLTLLPGGQQTFAAEMEIWRRYFENPGGNGGLRVQAIHDPQELHDLTAFFSWAAWSSVTTRPGTHHSYTNNFPYDAQAGNHPSGAAIAWSAASLIALLGGIAIVLLAFGKFDYLGWHGAPSPRRAWTLSPAQAATLKFMAVAALVFLAQTLVGAGVAHYRAEPGSFYGVDLSAIFPSNLLRAWHLQTAIFWIATSYVAGALFVAELLGGASPRHQVAGINLLFSALLLVVAGSLLGEWASLMGWLPKSWFWVGDQGWEYLEIGRLWQILLAAGLLFWFFLVWRAVAPARRDPETRGFANFFLIAAFAIPLFYTPALFFGAHTNYTIVDAWRFWIIHLWVEGFFEFFVTVIVSIIFYEMGLVRRITALRTIYLDAILYFGGGLIGTGHHWYWTGQTELNMAVSAVFSALEVVPLTLITLDAWDFVKVTRGDAGMVQRHRWTFYFLMAVGFWNFLGAGVFGFLINTPIVSYFEIGTILTPNHGHAAMMGVFGMLGIALMLFVLREVIAERAWPAAEKLVRISFWGLNIGLAMMLVFSLFPGGVLQVLDVIENGYWHARSMAYTASPLARSLEWARMPGDLVFIFAGVTPVVLAMALGYLSLWRGR
ncbi:MAG TPA: cbb3-type cytochrome c oxidase subunit I [Rhizomicrobium sp.]|nr:cbb3-type cytochrome c oxidase subunit I [Rhizomicrobium sp.]